MKILVVDDHALIRDALRGVLSALLPSDAIVLEAVRSSQALELVTDNPDIELVLLDLGLPDSDGFTTLATLRDRHPAVAVAILSASRDREQIERALELGAQGFIPKSASREIMLGALSFILSGGVYIPPEILQGTQARPVSGVTGERALPPASQIGLTVRQREVLLLMMKGMSNKSICRRLAVAEPTVKNHVTAILKALGASNRTQAVVSAGALMLPGDENGN